MSSAERKRRYRQRLRAGECVLLVTVKPDQLAEALIDTGRAAQHDESDLGKLAEAVADLLSDFQREVKNPGRVPHWARVRR